MPSICRASSDQQQQHHHNHRGKGDRWAQAAWGGADGGSGYHYHHHHHRRNRRFSRDGWIPWNPQERMPWRTMQEDEEFEEVRPKKKKNQRRRQQHQQQHGQRPRSPPPPSSSCQSPLLHIRPHSPPPLPPRPSSSSSSTPPPVVTAILTRPTHWVKVATAPPPLHPSTPFHLYNHLRHPCEKSSGTDLAGSVTKDGWTTLYKTDGRKESDSFSGRDGSCWFTTFYSGPQGKERAIMKVYHEDHMLPELRGMVEWYKGEKGKEDMFFRGPVGQAPPPSLHGPW